MAQYLCKSVGNTLGTLDGHVLSCNPSSNNPPYGPYHFTLAPNGTNGPYEQVAISGNIATYNPLSKDAVSYLLVPVPNAGDGVLSLSDSPLK